MIRYNYSFVLIAACFISTSQAQKTPFGSFNFGRSHLNPTGFMHESIGNGKGFNASAMFRIHKLPLQVGYTHLFNQHQFFQTPIDYSDNGIIVKATAEAQSRSNVMTLFLRKEFLFKTRPGLVPYLDLGGGSTMLTTRFRIFSEKFHQGASSINTTYTTTHLTVATPNPDYDNCVPNDQDPLYTYSTIQVTTSSTTVQSGSMIVRSYYEVKDILKNNTWHAYLGTGINIAVLYFNDLDSDINFDDNELNSNMNFYNESRGLFFNFGGGLLFGGNMNYLNLTQADHSHALHHNENTKAYTVDFRNLQTNEVHAHQVGTIYNSPLRAFYFQVGITMKI